MSRGFIGHTVDMEIDVFFDSKTFQPKTRQPL